MKERKKERRKEYREEEGTKGSGRNQMEIKEYFKEKRKQQREEKGIKGEEGIRYQGGKIDEEVIKG